MGQIRKLLIANRGEIAVRVQRSCREMDIRTVAVYSEVDRNALHVRFADEAHPIGGPAPTESYLRGDRILEVARRSGADAIHPGFGFLSENAAFARAVTEAGVIFVGPPPEAMEVMGDKIRSRQAMQAAGVPVTPGTAEPLADAAEARRAAAEVGYPVMLKASAGGGGKGIRVVRGEDEIEGAFRTASAEAENAFGDGRMYVEKFLTRPRHIEIQVLGDHHGRLMHLGERECSIQRRHQKLIEEAPSPIIDAETRERMGAAAVAAAKAVSYSSAGTVEFLWSEGEFYFLEMNTRLQVEHGVTEEIYGVDLVEQMIRIASGEKLALRDGLQPRGHAIEVRLNAEDPAHGFLPAVGTIHNLRLPGGPGVRIDSAMYRGMEVTPHYDSMLTKLITSGGTREQAIRRMERVLQELHVGGVVTSAGVALQVLDSPGFRSGDYDNGSLDSMMESLADGDPSLRDDAAIAGVLHRHRTAQRQALRPDAGGGDALSPWVAQGRWRRLERGFR